MKVEDKILAAINRLDASEVALSDAEELVTRHQKETITARREVGRAIAAAGFTGRPVIVGKKLYRYVPAGEGGLTCEDFDGIVIQVEK